MNLHHLLAERQGHGSPVRVGIVGCGKFASMFLAQVPRTPGIHVMAIADLDPGRARDNLAAVGWPAERYGAAGLDDARRHGTTWITDDAGAVFETTNIELVVDATGDPAAGVGHALRACAHGKSIIMVNVEADALAGPLLARRARESGVIYSLAYGDQPALICELVDWARASGFDVSAAGRGHKWRPEYRGYTPDNVWDGYGLTPEQARLGGLNPRMFTSFLDGTKPAIESTAVANATGLTPAPGGLAYPPCNYADLPDVMRPRAEGGLLDHKGQVEVISSLHPDGTPVGDDVRWGVWVVVEAGNDYVARCFGEYGLVAGETGRYACMYKPWHLIGLELGISVAMVGGRREPTGCATGWRADAVAMAKRDLAIGELLDGEGGYTVSGHLMSAADSIAAGALPIGLANKVALRHPVPAGRILSWDDVAIDDTAEAVKIRREMERLFAPDPARAAE